MRVMIQNAVGGVTPFPGLEDPPSGNFQASAQEVRTVNEGLTYSLRAHSAFTLPARFVG